MYKTLLQSKVHSQGHIDGCLLHRLLWHILSWTNHEGDFCVCEAKLRTKAEHDMFGFEKQKWVESVFTNSQQWRLTEYDSYVFLGLASLSLGPLGTSAQAQWGSCNEERCAQKFCVLHLCRKLVFFLSNPLSLETLNDIWQGQMNSFYFIQSERMVLREHCHIILKFVKNCGCWSTHCTSAKEPLLVSYLVGEVDRKSEGMFAFFPSSKINFSRKPPPPTTFLKLL